MKTLLRNLLIGLSSLSVGLFVFTQGVHYGRKQIPVTYATKEIPFPVPDPQLEVRRVGDSFAIVVIGKDNTIYGYVKAYDPEHDCIIGKDSIRWCLFNRGTTYADKEEYDMKGIEEKK